MTDAIVVDHLTHRFGERTAIDDLSFSVRQGEVFALMGPNGAGKTTTIRVLNGLYTPAVRTVRVLGLDPALQGDQVRAQTGVLTETNALYERLTAAENLLFFGRLYGVPESFLLKRTSEILEQFGLSERANDRVATFSKGMKQRLSLARAFLHQPRVLFLDEPTASLDPESTAQVHEMVEAIQKQDGHTVFLCTHHLEEAERLADRVAILNNGRLLALGSLQELNQRFNPGLWVEIRLFSPLEGTLQPGQPVGLLETKLDGQAISARVAEDSVIPRVIEELVLQKAEILSVTPLKRSLEEIYFSLQAEAREALQ